MAALAAVGFVIFGLGAGIFSAGAVDEKKPQYPEPRFPSTFKNPRSVDEVMPYARSMARNKSNFLGMGLGILNAGDKVLIIGDATSEDIYTDALKRALTERKVQVTFTHDYELAGVTRKQALDYMNAIQAGITSEQGYMEACGWMRTFPGSLDWLKKQRPDLAEACFPKKNTEDIPEELKAIGRKLRPAPGTPSPVATYVVKYVEQHPDLRGFFYGRGGPVWLQFHPHEDKWLGIFVMDNRWDMMTGNGAYPADLWLLTEEQTMEPLASVDKVRANDPEGTDVTWDMTEEQAQRWVRGLYLRGHLFLFPNEAYGAFSQGAVDYPVIHDDYIPLEPIVLINGTVAGTNGHGGFFPRIEEHWKDGYLVDVKGGGTYGELLRTFMKYPKIHEVTYPQFKHPGFFRHFETALGTNPKFIRHPLDKNWGTAPERMRAGVFHWALGAYFWHDPGPKYTGPTQLVKKFSIDNKMPGDHGYHIHTYFTTYQVHLRNTSKWVTLVDKGRLSSLDSPQARSLASRYGDPEKVTATDWIPDMPGINVPGEYLKDYANNPYGYSTGIMKKIEAGTYNHYYPPVKSQASAGVAGAAK